MSTVKINDRRRFTRETFLTRQWARAMDDTNASPMFKPGVEIRSVQHTGGDMYRVVFNTPNHEALNTNEAMLLNLDSMNRQCLNICEDNLSIPDYVVDDETWHNYILDLLNKPEE